MILRYLQFSPTGNVTVLSTTPVPRALQPRIAARLLADDCVGGEQAGFVEPATDARADARLQMMGGEFCGNAAMSLGALLAREAGLADGEGRDFRLEVSGSAGLVPCRIVRESETWVGTVDMPLPTGLDAIAIDTDAGPLAAPLVRFPGIAHLILPAGAGPGEAELRRRMPAWNAKIGADALGALLWDEAEASIDPLVYVPAAGTLVREHGCGSGTAAIGSWKALATGKDVDAAIRQPGGTITVRARASGGAVAALSITGRVTLLREGEARVVI